MERAGLCLFSSGFFILTLYDLLMACSVIQFIFIVTRAKIARLFLVGCDDILYFVHGPLISI